MSITIPSNNTSLKEEKEQIDQSQVSIGTLISTFICSMLRMNKLKKARTVAHMLEQQVAEEAAARKQSYFFYQKSMLLKHDEKEIAQNKQVCTFCLL